MCLTHDMLTVSSSKTVVSEAEFSSCNYEEASNWIKILLKANK